MTRYTIIATIEGVGRIQHITHAGSVQGAQDVIRAAYPGKTVVFEKTEADKYGAGEAASAFPVGRAAK
jgi:hypothetical protein